MNVFVNLIYTFVSLRIIAEVLTGSNATNTLKSISLFSVRLDSSFGGLTFTTRKFICTNFEKSSDLHSSTSVSFLSICIFIQPFLLQALPPQLRGCH